MKTTMPSKTCHVVDCVNKRHSREYCNKHYSRWKKFGDPLKGKDRFSSPQQAYAARTTMRESGCLEWSGSTANGYGQLYVDGKLMYAHRFAYIQEHGAIPEGLVIDHMCHNKLCSNVGHLRAITQGSNSENRIGLRSDNTSGYSNVYWHKPTKNWMVLVTSKGVQYFGGYFATAEEANVVATEMRLKYHVYNDRDRGYDVTTRS